jgi:hypothetical protein
MANKQGQSALDTRGTVNDLARKQNLVQQVLGDPSLFPDEFKSWIVRWLYGNVNLSITQGQLPVIEKAHLVGASGQIAFGGTWANFGGSNEPALYWKDTSGIVHVGGIVKSGVIGTTIFTLPAGYRPQYAMIFAVSSNNLFGVCTINPDGTVVATAGSATYFSLSGITFRQYA